jgi:hypothetical protein
MPRHFHAAKPAIAELRPHKSLKLPAAAESSEWKCDIPVHAISLLDSKAKAILHEVRLQLVDCAELRKEELAAILHITAEQAHAFLAATAFRAKSAAAAIPVAAQRAPAAAVPLVPKPARKDWLKIAISAGPSRLTLVTAKASKTSKPSERRASLLETIFEVAVALGSSSTRKSDAIAQYSAASEVPEVIKQSFLAQFKNLDTETIAKRVSCFKRWATYSATHLPSDTNVLQPESQAMIRFLASVSKAGPAAAVDCYKLLQWWRNTVGVPLPMQDPAVASWSTRDPEYTLHQRTPLPIFVFVQAFKLAQSAVGTISRFAKFVLLLLMACLRYKHLNISMRLRIEDNFLRGTCPRGKRRVQGSRPAYDWACPLGLAKDKPILAELVIMQREFEEALGKEPGFVIPDIVLDPFGKVSSTSKILLQPMPLPKFIRVLQSFCLACGMDQAAARDVTSYGLRRFLPTVAGSIKLPEHLAEAIGDWQQSASAKAAPQSMSARYNDDKVLMAADVKARLLMCIGQKAKQLQSADISWDTMRAAFVWEDVCRWQLPTFQNCQQGSQASPTLSAESKEIANAPESESDDSESTSDSDSDDNDEAIEWFRQSKGGKHHLIQGVQGSCLVPWCRSAPFSALHAERGGGTDISFDWCTTCVQRCPLKLSRILASKNS